MFVAKLRIKCVYAQGVPRNMTVASKYLQLFECGIFLRFWKFLNWLEISKIPRHLGNFPNTQTFPKCLGFWKTPQISSSLRNFQNLKNIPPSNTYSNLGNFPNTWVSGKFLKCLGFGIIPKISSHLRSFQNLKNVFFQNFWSCLIILYSSKIIFKVKYIWTKDLFNKINC